MPKKTTQNSAQNTIKNGLVEHARYVPSPNHDQRCDESDISLIVIHNISLPPSEFGGPYIDQLFTNTLNPDAHPFFKEIEGLEVSSHFLIRRDGELVQYVPIHKRAWHAGKSEFAGRSRCNDFAIGIELEGDDFCVFENAQYERLNQLIAELKAQYSGLNNTCGHSDIAPGRKTDPGPFFDWDKVKAITKP